MMMSCIKLKIWLLNLVTFSSMLSLSYARPNAEFRVKAVNLGGWLVTEGWMKPSLFDAIPNKDFLDGTGLQFKSVTTGKYLCAESVGGTTLVSNRTVASGWETFREHWSTFIVEDDFKSIANNGLNAVRIPVGWWIASDPTPPPPYVGGSLNALDNAFLWAEKYGVKVIIDLHAAPGSQNGFEHSSSRDSLQEWGISDENIQQTVQVIDFLAARYAKSPSLYAVELLNEPLSPGATLESLNKYYKAGYEAVRKHSSTAYVVLSNRIGPSKPTELFPLANGLMRSVIDVHYYNLFTDVFNHMNVQQNIDFINTNRSSLLNYVPTLNGPLTFVGDCVAGWLGQEVTKEGHDIEWTTFKCSIL